MVDEIDESRWEQVGVEQRQQRVDKFDGSRWKQNRSS